MAVPRHHAQALLEEMLRIRRFEERSVELCQAQKIRGFHPSIGAEAIAAGAMAALGPEDAVLTTCHQHGHALARGMSMKAAMAEMYGKVDGCCRGRGGATHLFDARLRFFGGSANAAGQLPMAVGFGLADRLREGLGAASQAHAMPVTACCFEEAAVADGDFHESMNLAALWKLPVLFICENDLHAVGTALARSGSESDLVIQARTYGVRAESVDGMNALAVEAAVRSSASAARSGDGPQFLELRTYRLHARDPITFLKRALAVEDMLSDAEWAAMEARIAAELETAVAFAEAAPWEAVEDLARDVTTPTDPASYRRPAVPPPGPAVKTTARDAIRAAIREAIEEDPRVFLIGENVAHHGGCFGPGQVRDTPRSESAFVGAGIGAALNGMRAIVEVMTANFSLLALDQVVNQAAALRHMSGGQLSVPVVIRMATGAGRPLAAQHSNSLEAHFAHVPGLRVVTPATLADARGMLWTALQHPDPVIIFENASFYHEEGELAPDTGPVDIDHAKIRREGCDVTLVTYGGSLAKVMHAADILAREGIAAEVIDLRTLRPLDDATVQASVARTRHVVIIDACWRSGGIAAEVAARIAEVAFYELDAPVRRVCGVEVPIPYAHHLELASVPSVAGIVAAAREVVGRG